MRGYIRDKMDAKLLILYILNNSGGPVAADALMDMSLFDESFGYFEYSETLSELIEDSLIDVSKEKLHSITKRGLAALSPYESRLPHSLRRDAQRSVLRVLTRLRREESIICETIIRAPGDMTERLVMKDGDDTIVKLELMIVNHDQALRLEENFRRHPDKIYNEILGALLRDYDSYDE